MLRHRLAGESGFGRRRSRRPQLARRRPDATSSSERSEDGHRRKMRAAPRRLALLRPPPRAAALRAPPPATAAASGAAAHAAERSQQYHWVCQRARWRRCSRAARRRRRARAHRRAAALVGHGRAAACSRRRRRRRAWSRRGSGRRRRRWRCITTTGRSCWSRTRRSRGARRQARARQDALPPRAQPVSPCAGAPPPPPPAPPPPRPPLRPTPQLLDERGSAAARTPRPFSARHPARPATRPPGAHARTHRRPLLPGGPRRIIPPLSSWWPFMEFARRSRCGSSQTCCRRPSRRSPDRGETEESLKAPAAAVTTAEPPTARLLFTTSLAPRDPPAFVTGAP